ncbi:MAG: S8 family serine peptidase, partial [Candidatus Sericytochromatia bacterium]
MLPLALLAACQAPGLTPPATLPTPTDVSGEVVVRFEPETAAAEREAIRAELGVQAATSLMPDAERWRLGSEAAAERALAATRSDARFKLAQANHVRRLSPVMGADPIQTLPYQLLSVGTNDPETSKQWHLARSGFPRVWDRTQGEGITVAVIDSGVDPNHPDLKDNLLPMIDEVLA